jgi:hypothetical protein
VAPDAGNTTAPMNATGQRVEFTLTNTSTQSDQYSITCAISGAVTSCVPDTDWYDVPANGTVVIGVTYSTGTVPYPAGGSGTITVTATSDNLIEGGPNPERDSGDFHVTVSATPTYSVSVTPDGSADSLVVGDVREYTFEVHNLGNTTNTFTFVFQHRQGHLWER